MHAVVAAAAVAVAAAVVGAPRTKIKQLLANFLSVTATILRKGMVFDYFINLFVVVSEL